MLSIVRLERFCLSDECCQGVVELGQGLHVDGEAGVPVLGDGVQGQPGQGVVAFQHEPKTQHHEGLSTIIGL